MRIDIEKIKIQQVVDAIQAQYPDDDQLLADMVEGETDLYTIAGRLLEANEHDNGMLASLDSQIADRQSRKARFKLRVSSRRDAILDLMQVAKADKLELAEATISVRKVAPKLKVVQPDLVPDELCKFTRKPDMAAIKASNDTVDGTAMDNGGYSLTVRTK